MDELLQKLLESQVLSEETKTELESAFKTKIDEAAEEARVAAAAEARVALQEQFIAERDALVEAIDSKVTEFLDSELEELREDIERFRDLEAEYAEKLVEARAEMGKELQSDLVELIEKLDTFLEMRLTAELEELREDFVEVRKNDFGRRVFEAFASEYVSGYAADDTVHADFRKLQGHASTLAQALDESTNKLRSLERSIKLEGILKPLMGKQREVMEAILKNVDTPQLEEAYKTFIGRVIRESDESGSEKESSVLAEGVSKKTVAKKQVKTLAEKVSTTVLATGDSEDIINEGENDGMKQRLVEIRRLAGLV